MHEVWRAESDEWQTYREIRLAALADAPDAFGSTLEQEAGLTEADWRDRLANAAIFLGKRDGKVLALAAGLPLDDNEVELVSVWAHPSARGTGLAADVIRAVLDWARGAPKISAWVSDKNSTAERLYTKLGFVRTGRQEPLPRDPSILEVEMVLRAD